MVLISVGECSKKVTIHGHGIVVPTRFEISPGIVLSPETPKLELAATVAGCPRFLDYAAALNGSEIATFTLEVEESEGGKLLAAKAWNALWLFHLLSIACQNPCFSLYAVADGAEPQITSANRNPFARALPRVPVATDEQLLWARVHNGSFHTLISVPEFSSAMLCYGNAHYMFELDVRIMLLWAGIEGLLSVDAELNRRLALYAALLFEGTPEEKAEYFDQVRKAYGIRSRAVHGGRADRKKLEGGYDAASSILIRLLARCVELGRVPTPAELDRLAVSGRVR
jgi:hypothetical protein